MIRVTIEMLPGGNTECKRLIGQIEIVNDGTGTEEIGHYDVVITKEPPIAKARGIWKKGKVRNFPRKKLGPYDLLYKVCEELVGYRSITSHVN